LVQKANQHNVSIIYSRSQWQIIANYLGSLSGVNKKFGEKTGALIFAAL
jgi:hypothetical protein